MELVSFAWLRVCAALSLPPDANRIDVTNINGGLFSQMNQVVKLLANQEQWSHRVNCSRIETGAIEQNRLQGRV
jgi:hypothetical protein